MAVIETSRPPADRIVKHWLTRPLVNWGAAVMAMLALILLWRYLTNQLTLGIKAAPPPQLGADFINYWLGAHFALLGKAAAVYDRAQFYLAQQALLGPDAAYKIYVYPPPALLATMPLAGFSFLAGLAVWTLTGMLLYAALLSRIVGWPLAAMAAVATPAAFLNILSGQNGFFTAAVLAGGLMLVERRPLAAGLVLGLLSCKPQIGSLVPLALLAGHHWRTLIGAAAMAALLLVASTALCGAAAWSGFFDQMHYLGQLTSLPHDDWFRRMPTLYSALRLLRAPPHAVYAGQAVSTVAAAAAVALVWRGAASGELKAAVLITATFLATPYAWDYDMVALLFVVAWLLRSGAGAGYWRGEQLLAVALVALPVLMVAGVAASSPVVSLQCAPVVLWLAMTVLLRRCFARSAVSA